MKTSSAPFQPSLLLAPSRTIEFKIAGAPVSIPWSTPTRWWIVLGVIILTELLFVLAVRHAIDQRNDAFKKIASDSAPSIIAAQHIRASLADYDASLTNQLLCPPGSPDMKIAVENARSRRHEFTTSLLEAAGNITSPEAERGPIITIVNELGDYEAEMSRALTLQEAGNLAPAAAASREASRRMHERILPAADALDAANSEVLDRTYAAQADNSFWSRVWMGVTGMFYLAALAGAQWALWRATRRRINLGLFAATGLAFCFILYGAAASHRSTQQLKIITKDALDSVRYLWKARSIAYDANGAESRWLYDQTHAAALAREFSDKAAQVCQLPAGTSFEELATAASADEHYRPPPDERGLLVEELRNITFEGERMAAATAVGTFGNYLEVDKKIRLLEAGGHHDQAVALCLSYKPGGSNAAFEEFDKALEKVLDINTKAYEQYDSEGVGDLRVFNWLIPGFAIIATCLASGGFWPRIKEYAT